MAALDDWDAALAELAREVLTEDYQRLAASYVTAGRVAAGMSHRQFAAHLAVTLGWDVLPETIEVWEDDVAPPGDVLLLCLSLAGHELPGTGTECG